MDDSCFHRARPTLNEIGILLPNDQRQHRTLHIQKDVLPYALCYLQCPASPAAVNPSGHGAAFLTLLSHPASAEIELSIDILLFRIHLSLK